MRLIVDGMNVIGSRPDGWWRDRTGAKQRLADRLAKLGETVEGRIEVVFDGRPMPSLPEGEHEGVEVRYATRGGRDAADDRIVELVRAAADRSEICVVTSDRALRERVRDLGASVQGAGRLLADLDAWRGRRRPIVGRGLDGA